MKIPDEYWTSEIPTEHGFYALKLPNGHIETCHVTDYAGIGIAYAVFSDTAYRKDHPEGMWCRLAPAAELEKLKAENERLRGLVRDAYEEGYWDCHDRKGFDNGINTSQALKRLDGMDEP